MSLTFMTQEKNDHLSVCLHPLERSEFVHRSMRVCRIIGFAIELQRIITYRQQNDIFYSLRLSEAISLDTEIAHLVDIVFDKLDDFLTGPNNSLGRNASRRIAKKFISRAMHLCGKDAARVMRLVMYEYNYQLDALFFLELFDIVKNEGDALILRAIDDAGHAKISRDQSPKYRNNLQQKIYQSCVRQDARVNNKIRNRYYFSPVICHSIGHLFMLLDVVRHQNRVTLACPPFYTEFHLIICEIGYGKEILEALVTAHEIKQVRIFLYRSENILEIPLHVLRGCYAEGDCYVNLLEECPGKAFGSSPLLQNVGIKEKIAVLHLRTSSFKNDLNTVSNLRNVDPLMYINSVGHLRSRGYKVLQLGVNIDEDKCPCVDEYLSSSDSDGQLKCLSNASMIIGCHSGISCLYSISDCPTIFTNMLSLLFSLHLPKMHIIQLKSFKVRNEFKYLLSYKDLLDLLYVDFTEWLFPMVSFEPARDVGIERFIDALEDEDKLFHSINVGEITPVSNLFLSISKEVCGTVSRWPSRLITRESEIILRELIYNLCHDVRYSEGT